MGLGPGGAGHLTPKAREVLAASQVLVGYDAYLDLVPPELKAGKEIFVSGMRKEMARAERAVDFALAGLDTAVVCSGDAGVYGMAGLVLEYLPKRDPSGRISCEVVAGVPAFVAAAALFGAPLMHDFASISLSDLLTPWELIGKRLDAAASADFVIVLYNPRSRRRVSHLTRAIEIIARHRGPQTPVGVARNVDRPDESALIVTLAALNQATVDMTTIVIIGNSQSRAAGNRIITPRGYFDKYGEPDPAPQAPTPIPAAPAGPSEAS